MQTLDSYDSGSNYKFGDKLQVSGVPRSMFDLSHLNTMTIDNAGMLIPISLIKTVPGDSFEISVDSLLRVLPQVVPLYSRQRLYIHAFKSNYSDLWNDAQVYMTKGYTGNTVLSRPALSNDNLANFTSVTPGSLLDYLGLPIGMTRSQVISNEINALPFMMYTRIYRDYFMNKNFYTTNKMWLPDDDHDFMLRTDGSIASNPSMNSAGPKLGELYYRDFPQDYFTSALPFPQRGDTPTLSFNISTESQLPVGATVAGLWHHLQSTFYTNAAGNGVSDARIKGSPGYLTLQGDTESANYYGTLHSDNVDANHVFSGNTYYDSYLYAKLDNELAYSTITLNQLRDLSAQQSILEKMARTDGSYGEFGLTFFGRRSKSSMDYKPVYIGGTYQSIAFTEVLQTSRDVSSPLGSYAGHGISYQNQGYIGRCDCDDYGYIMILASIMPDVYYSQGLDRELTNRLSSEEYLPERSRLGMREILNKELYFDGSSADNDLFAYQTPFDEYRYKASVIHGKIADSTNLTFFPYTQSRKFSSRPTYSQSFARADNVRKDYLSAPTESAYTAQFSLGIRAVRPIPYNPVPAQII